MIYLSQVFLYCCFFFSISVLSYHFGLPPRYFHKCLKTKEEDNFIRDRRSRSFMFSSSNDDVMMSSGELGLAYSIDSLSQQSNNRLNVVSIGNPRVLPPLTSTGGDDSKWKLWFHSRETNTSSDIADLGTGRVYYATSSDGVNDWNIDMDSAIALKSGQEIGDWWWFDSEHVGLGDIIKPGNSAQEKFISQGSMFLMYSFGGNSDKMLSVDNSEQVKGLKMEIGVSVSQDGIHWSKVEGPSAYGSVLEVGTPSQFDSQFVGWPCVVEANTFYFMYYHTYNPVLKKFVVGLATATDGLLKWTKRGPVFEGGKNRELDFDGLGVTRRHVVRLPDLSFRMWYEGVSSAGVHSIGLATSFDGFIWEKVSDEPVFAPSEEMAAWDSGSVGSPHLVWLEDKRRWRMYYTGSSSAVASNANVGSNDIGMGIAESLDEEGMYFKRIQIQR